MKILLIIEYKGTDFAGWQFQPKKRTIQNEIETVFFTLFSQKVVVYGSGRTDSGVHSIGQSAHFEIDRKTFLKKFADKHYANKKEVSKTCNERDSFNNFILAMNSNLPDDIKILKAKKVANSFHARFDVQEKIYLYKLQIGKSSPLTNGFVGLCKEELNLEKMRQATSYLIGKNDFTSFSSSKTGIKDFTRTINYIKIKKESKNIIAFEISGNGFLYNMVRIIVGTLIEVGSNRIQPQTVKTILEAKDRTKAGKTVQACGLYLKKVKY